jgi:hypothetical protein
MLYDGKQGERQRDRHLAHRLRAEIQLREKRTAGQVQLHLSQSDVDQLEATRQLHGIIMPAGTVAYHCFKLGLGIVRKKLEQSQKRTRPRVKA